MHCRSPQLALLQGSPTRSPVGEHCSHSLTSIAAIVLAVSGLVAWPQTACAFAGATIVGCLLGSRLARLMSPKLLRLCVIAFGCALSAYYFFKHHGRSDA